MSSRRLRVSPLTGHESRLLRSRPAGSCLLLGNPRHLRRNQLPSSISLGNNSEMSKPPARCIALDTFTVSDHCNVAINSNLHVINLVGLETELARCECR